MTVDSTLHGSGVGISADSFSVIRGNNCTGNTAVGNGLARGISATGNSLVEYNNSAGHTANIFGQGIFVVGPDTVVRGNTTSGNSISIHFNNAGNRSELNRMADGAFTFSGAQSVGTGDMADVVY